jgi:hypothetical protein
MFTFLSYTSIIDLSVEGIFRKNGNIRGLKQLSEQSTQDDFEQELGQQNSVQLAALLKKYLRELPEPLLTFRLYDLFLTSGAQKNILAMACCLLPKPNRDTMLLIFCCLKQVATMSERNKMDVANLACVVAPNVLFCRPNGGDPRKGAQAEINVVEYLIRYSEELSIVCIILYIYI